MWERLTHRLASAGLPVDPAAATALTRYLDELSRWNRVHNLTAITEPDEMIRRHAVESLALRGFLRGRRVADVGSGAGVPGIPLAIAEPQRHFTLIDSRGKRAAFLRHVQGLLELSNVSVAHGRVEDMKDAGPFDTLLVRALAPLDELPRLTAHLFGPDTVMLALTGEKDRGRLTVQDERFDVRLAGGAIAGLFSGALLLIHKKEGQ